MPELNEILSGLATDGRLEQNSHGYLEVDEDAAGDIVLAAAKEGRRLEILGTKDDGRIVLRPSRRLDSIVFKGGKVDWKGELASRMVMLD